MNGLPKIVSARTYPISSARSNCIWFPNFTSHVMLEREDLYASKNA